MVIDAIAALIALLGFLHGRNKGIVSILFRILSFVFGLVLSFKMAPTMARLLGGIMNSDSPFLFPFAFIVNLIFITGLFSLAARGSEGVFRAMRVNFINQFLGGLLSAFFYLFLYGALLWFAKETRLISERAKEESGTFEFLAEMPKEAGNLFQRVKPFVLEAWDASIKWMDKAKEYGEQKVGQRDTSTSPSEQPRIYKIEEGADGKIEKKPYSTSGKNREIYEDTGIEY